MTAKEKTLCLRVLAVNKQLLVDCGTPFTTKIYEKPYFGALPMWQKSPHEPNNPFGDCFRKLPAEPFLFPFTEGNKKKAEQ